MQDIKQNLADAVREARTKLGLSQEQCPLQSARWSILNFS